MSGGGDGSGKMLKFEKEQIAAAEAKEAERQARLAQGKSAIDKAFSGIGDSFYENYKANYLKYYMPQLQRQFGDARKALLFGLARAGTLKSSMAADRQAKLYEDRMDRDAMIRSQADSATGDLRGNVADAKSSAITQLYATEDPSLATNMATNSIRALQSQTPKYDPLGELFNVGAVGAAGYINANSQRASSAGSAYGAPGTASQTRTVK
jgi:hypothetical protein